MREILFRGKRKDNGEWLYGGAFHQEEDDIKEEAYYIIGGSLSDVGCAYPVKPETVGQYTGLTDKNGKKIFEGDIVKTKYANARKNKFIEEVVFQNGKFMALYKRDNSKMLAPLPDGIKHLSIDKTVYMTECEIIGNIFDNPELLGGAEDE